VAGRGGILFNFSDSLKNDDSGCYGQADFGRRGYSLRLFGGESDFSPMRSRGVFKACCHRLLENQSCGARRVFARTPVRTIKPPPPPPCLTDYEASRQVSRPVHSVSRKGKGAHVIGGRKGFARFARGW